MDVLRDYTRFLEAEGSHGLFPCGTTGEFASLTLDQRETVIRTVSETAESIPVFAGCGDTVVSRVREQIERAAASGADAAVVVTPYYLPAAEDGLCQFFEQAADQSKLPIFIYNIPELTGESLSVEAVCRLAEHERIVGIKDTTGDLERLSALAESVPSSFHLFQGYGPLALPSLQMGADGIIAGSANVFPHALRSIYEADRENDHDHAMRIVSEIVFPFLNSFGDVSTLSGVKHLLTHAGFDMGPPLPPLPQLTDDEKRTVDRSYTTIRDRYESIRTSQPTSEH